MLAVGLGPGAPDSELKSIAMENSDNVMKIGSFDQLTSNLQKITKDLCQGKVGQILLCSALESVHRVNSATSHVAHQTGAYSGFCSMKRLRVFLKLRCDHRTCNFSPKKFSGLQRDSNPWPLR